MANVRKSIFHKFDHRIKKFNTPFWNPMTVTYTSQTFCESPLFMPTDVQSTNGPWMNPGQAINYVTWHRISAVTQYPCWALLYTANNIFPHSTSPFLNVIGKKWLLPVWSFQTKVRQITHNRVIMLYFTPSYDYRLETSSTDWVNISLSVNVASSLKSVLKNRESLGPGIFPMLFRPSIFLMTKLLKWNLFW